MYYRLKDDYLLRGWEKLPTGIVKKLSGQVFFLKPAFYSKIKDMSWMMFEGSPFLSQEEKEIMDKLVEEGIVELTRNLQPFSPEQQYRYYPNRYLRAVHWAITGHCNCRCKHCYMSAPTGKIEEYSTQECMNIIDQMEEAGIQVVSLTGGEALVRKDFIQLVERITRAGIKITTIMSNGLLVNEPLLQRLEEIGQKPEFNMSFDGIGCHDWLRGIDGAEEAVIRAFRLCQEHSFPTGAEYCLHKGNKHAFHDSVHLLAELGCESLKVNGLSQEGAALQILDQILPLDEEYQFYIDYLPQFFEDGMPLNLMLSGLFMNRGEHCAIPSYKMSEDQDCGTYCLCGHARNWMHITADGFIVPCIPIGSVECGRKHFPNIHETTIVKALSDSTYMEFIDTRLNTYFAHNPECADCEYRNRCAGGCRGNASYTGDLLAKDDKVCTFFKNGWYDKVVALLRQYNKLPENQQESTMESRQDSMQG